jgi:general secretion pathway protein G
METIAKKTDVSKRAGHRARGFTLLEVILVMTIIVILATLSAGRYEQSIVHSREAALRQDLFVMRQAIQNYTTDKEQAPNSLDDLQTSGYIGAVPTDPITHQKDWVTDSNCPDVLSPDQVSGGICDVHSASEATSPFDGNAYNTY